MTKIILGIATQVAKQATRGRGNVALVSRDGPSFWLCYGSGMASIMLKDIPEEMHAQLKTEAEANFRSLTQEALMRIELSFRMEEAFNTKRDGKWIQEALESGPEQPLSRAKFDAAFRKARHRFEESKKAAL